MTDSATDNKPKKVLYYSDFIEEHPPLQFVIRINPDDKEDCESEDNMLYAASSRFAVRNPALARKFRTKAQAARWCRSTQWVHYNWEVLHIEFSK